MTNDDSEIANISCNYITDEVYTDESPVKLLIVLCHTEFALPASAGKCRSEI